MPITTWARLVSTRGSLPPPSPAIAKPYDFGRTMPTRTSVRLPETFWCYDPLTETPPVNSLPALDSGVVTFCCLNSFCKVNDGVLALWAQVLRAAPLRAQH